MTEGATPAASAEEPAAGGAPGRLDPERSACVLIGVDDYQHLPPLRSVPRNLRDLEKALADPDLWGVPDGRRWVVANPSTHGELTGPIYDAAKLAEDTLLVYYAGHGLLEVRDDQLYLTLPSSVRDRSETSLAYGVLRTILRESRRSVKRQIVILDCCYSGRALETVMAGTATRVPEKRQVEIEGSYVLTSTTESARAMAPPEEAHTAFTGELIAVLTGGDPGNTEQELLTLNQIYRLLKTRLAEKGLPEPQRLDKNGVGDLLFVRNQQGPRPSVQPSPAPARRAVTPLVAAALFLGLLLGAAVGYQVHGWISPGTRTDQIPGPCDAAGRARLLSVSDQLDQPPQNEYLGNPVEGLSALALTGDGSQALVLRDNEPAQVFALDLGPAEALEPAVTGTQLLYGPDGEPFESFDGEGMLVEEGGETILAAAESGPAIRRFGISDGRQIGDPLPLPDAFLPAPGGAAQHERNIESLTATPDGAHLFAGLEGPLVGDADVHGRHQVRIQRYTGEPGGDYALDRQYGYQTEVGLYLVELAAVDENRLLALERGFLTGLGNAIRLYEVDLTDAQDVTGRGLPRNAGDLLARKELLFDMAHCPEGDVVSDEAQPNQILDNVEGMALGPELRGTGNEGRRVLYLVSDDNGRHTQTTRLYSLAVALD
ncbi:MULTISPECIES: esterase-like activity of phytase family protein [unclassified Nocardiopsis]|uniref:caspase, EACC1-associated type n=1 Tax=unclassified Nocardiopsis TaxID=2649073 RepID=UPI001357A1D7|nr:MULTISPECIES: esterase-like activity of phytase family protein [unclassified Nocardiopsis]